MTDDRRSSGKLFAATPARASSTPATHELSSSGRIKLRPRATLFKVRCDVGSDLLTPVHAFVEAFASKRFRPTLAQAIALATHELLENALAYGSVSGDVTFELSEGGQQLVLEVENDAVGPRITSLRSRVDALKVNAEATYLDEMQRAMTGRGPRATLGLARVCHEAKMQVDVEVDDKRVRVTARCAT